MGFGTLVMLLALIYSPFHWASSYNASTHRNITHSFIQVFHIFTYQPILLTCLHKHQTFQTRERTVWRHVHSMYLFLYSFHQHKQINTREQLILILLKEFFFSIQCREFWARNSNEWVCIVWWWKRIDATLLWLYIGFASVSPFRFRY